MSDLLFENPKNRLETLMQENKYTLRKVSEDTNIPITTLSGYKKNLRTPKKNNAKILADYFGVSVPYLLGFDDKPTLRNPGNESFWEHFKMKMTKGTLVSENIDEWTPFKDELAVILKEINQSDELANYIDFIASKNDFNPVLVKAVKQFIADKEDELLPYLINTSGSKDSPYHYVWKAWENSDEYKEQQEARKHKK